MRHLWLKGLYDLEVLKPQVDDSGYDLVFEMGSIVRHVQLKSTKRGSSLSNVTVNLHLAKKPSGCVILIEFDPGSLKLGPFYWFGGAAGKKLPDVSSLRVARHARGNAQGVKRQRPNIRQIPLSKLQRLDTINEVIENLFGSAASDSNSPSQSA